MVINSTAELYTNQPSILKFLLKYGISDCDPGDKQYILNATALQSKLCRRQ
jgi:hypothetical protein